MSFRSKQYIYHALMISFGFFMLYPILWMIASSLKTDAEIFGNALSLLPFPVNWSNYPQGWQSGRVGFAVFFRNSFIITSSVVVGAIFSSSLIAFGFARCKFALRSFWFACMLGTIMLPIQVTLIPQYILFSQIGWVNTWWPLIVPSFLGGIPFFIFLLVQFMRGLPYSLDEAGYIDGCSTFGVFSRIILPLCKPALVTVAIFAFMWTWDDFLSPLIYINDARLYTVSVGISLFSDPNVMTEWGPLLAMSTLSLLPQFLIFAFFQRYIVEGVATTGVKG